MRGQFNAETRAQPFHVFDILFGGHVSMSMAQHLDYDLRDGKSQIPSSKLQI